MGNDTTTVGFNITDNGTTKKLVKDVSELDSRLQSAAKSASYMASTAAKATKAQLESATMSSSDRLGYGVARSAVGTGAEGRDFAKQAQGLGGLVRLYATFAANLFAVGAAFSALRNAADTTNMIKGLDQLGAASGKNLGGVSKELVKLTDGAISLREAMTATVQATSAGMSTENLKKLAIGAKNASQALGIGMSDALSRLSRGITKLEPELLDELGVFVRIDDSVNKYARSLGKPVSALTDLERRTAFSVDVLDQLDKKFGDIKIDSNPYDKLLSSLKDIGQQALELVNKVLGPMIGALSESPTALKAALVAASIAIVKQALPALGSIKEELNASAEAARKVANARLSEADRAYALELQRAYTAAEEKADIEVHKVDEAQKRVQAIRNASFKDSAAMQEIFSKTSQELSKQDIKLLEDKAKALAKTGDHKAAADYANAATALRSWKTAEEDLIAVRQKNVSLMSEEANALSTRGMIQQIAHRSNLDAISREISATAAQTASTNGFITAMKQAHAEIQKARQSMSTMVSIPLFDKNGIAVVDDMGNQITKLVEKTTSGMGVMRTGWTYLSSGISAATGAIATFMNFMGPWVALISMVTVASGLLLDYFSKTKKEAKAFAESTDALTSSLENAEKVIDRLKTKNPLEAMSIEAIQAKANALGSLTDTLGTDIAKGFAVIEKTENSTLDRVIDRLKSLYNGDLRTTLAKSFSETMVKSIELAEDTPAKKAAMEYTKKILNITDLNTENITEAVKKLSDTAAKKYLPAIQEAWKKVNQEQSITAAKGTELVETYRKAGDTFKELSNSFIPSDNVSKMGMAMQEAALKLDIALKDPVQSLNAMKKVVEDVGTLSLFPPETAAQLLAAKTDIDRYAKQIAELNDQLAASEKQHSSLISRYREAAAGLEELQGTGAGASARAKEYKDELASLAIQLENLAKKSSTKIGVKLDIEAKVEGMKNTFKEAVTAQMVEGATLVSSRIAAEWAKGAATATNAVAGILGKSLAANELRAKAEQAQLAAQRDAIKTQIDLITSNEKLTTELELTRISSEKRVLSPSDEKYQKLTSRESALTEKKSLLDSGVKQGTTKALAKRLADGVGEAKEALAYAQKIESAMAQLNSISAQSYSIEIQKKAADIAVISEQQKRSIENSKISAQIDLDKLSALEAEGKILSDQQLIERTNLENRKVEYDYQIKVNDIEEQISIKRLGMVELLKRGNLTLAQSVAQDIARLQTGELVNAAKQKESDIIKNNAGLTGKQLANQIAMRDRVLDTAHAYEQMALSQRQTATEVLNTNLETLNSTGKLYDAEYIQKKRTLDLTQEKLGLDTKEIALRYEYNKIVNKLNDDLEKENDTTKKKAILEDIAAAKAKFGIDMDNVRKLYDAKIDSIDKIAEYELQNTALANGLADAVWTGMTEGGEAGAKAVKQALMDELKKPMNIVIKALISPITSGLQSMFENLFMSLAGDIAGVINGGFSGIIPAIMALFSGGDGTSTFSKIGNAFSTISNVFSGVDKLKGWVTDGANQLEILSGSKYATTAMSQQSRMLAAQEAGMGSASALPGSFASTLGTVASYAGYGLSGYGLGSKIGGDYKIGNTSAKTTSGVGSVIGSIVGGPIGGLIGGTIGGLINRVFGTKTTVTDTGIEGTFGDQGFEGRTFKDIKKKSLFRRTRYSTQYGDMDQETKSALGNAFLSMRGGTAELAAGIGGAADSVSKYTKSIRLSLAGLTDAQAKTKLTEELGKMQEEMAALALGTKAYNKEGETSLQTLQRLSASFKAANQVFELLGQTALTASVSNADLADQYVNAFGGADKMAQISQQYFQDYYTEQERVDAQTRVLGKAFKDLGYELPKSRAELRSWIDEAQASGDPQTYAALMNLAGSFTAISDAAAAAAPKIRDSFSTLFSSIASKIMELTSTSKEYLDAQRQDELSALEPELRGLKKYQYALEDVKLAQAKVTEAKRTESDLLKQQQQTVQTSISSLKNFVNSFAKFKQSLLFDTSASVLSPEQKYAQAKAEFNAVLAAATSTGTSEADIARRTEALAKLESTSRTFLDTSRAVYASSATYTTDFNTVQNALTDAGRATEVQVSLAQQTVDGIQAQIDILTEVKTGIQDIASATIAVATANDELAAALGNAAIAKAAYTTSTTSEDIIAKAKEAFATMSKDNSKAPTYSELASGLYAKYNIDPAEFAKAVSASMFETMRDTPIVSAPEVAAEALVSSTDSLKTISITLEKTQENFLRGTKVWEELVTTQVSANTTLESILAKYNKDNSAIGGTVTKVVSVTGLESHAIGGLANGLSLVGESGPEIVDFRTPGRVYTADQTAGMFAGGPMVAVVEELKALRAEVAELRKQQSAETGHLINASFEAQQKNSEDIAKVLNDNTNKTMWNDKVKQAVTLN